MQKPATNTPAISVLIPVYNVERFLPRCLDSVLAQTFTDFEVICVNDASPDTSAVILAAYAASDPRIRIITHPSNLGPMKARETAYSNATGSYLFFLDADDDLPKNSLAVLYDAAIKDNSEITVGNMCLTNDIGKKTIRERAKRAGSTYLTYLDSLLHWNTPSLCGSLFHRRLFSQINPQALSQQLFSEDRLLLVEILTRCKPSIKPVCKTTYIYRQNPESSTHHKLTEADVASQFKVLGICHDLISKNAPSLSSANDRFIALSICEFAEKGFRKEFLENIDARTRKFINFTEMKQLVGIGRTLHTHLCLNLRHYSILAHKLHLLLWKSKGLI